ncbi:MAG TPA: TIGR02265 family protein [Myxococcaceae bacterium]|nr:TIGR02265 family protein [Myxococcaceae bacterium]
MEARLGLATPQDTVRGLFFLSMLEVVRALTDEATVERCLEATGEREFLEFFNYPASLLIRLTFTAGHELSARHGSFDEALRHLGRQAMADFFASAMGRSLLNLPGQDIRHLVSSMQTMYRMTMSYGERQVVWEGPTRGRLLLTRNFIPAPYHEGGLRTTLDKMGAPHVRVTGTQTALLDSEYEFSWGPPEVP